MSDHQNYITRMRVGGLEEDAKSDRNRRAGEAHYVRQALKLITEQLDDIERWLGIRPITKIPDVRELEGKFDYKKMLVVSRTICPRCEKIKYLFFPRWNKEQPLNWTWRYYCIDCAIAVGKDGIGDKEVIEFLESVKGEGNANR